MVKSTVVLSMVAVITLAGAPVAVYSQAAETTPAAQAPALAEQSSPQPGSFEQAQASAPSSQPVQPGPAASEQPAPQPDPMLQGTMNFQLGNYEEALDELTRARIKDPRSSSAAYYLGATLKKMQQYDKALPHLMEAVTLQPVMKEAYLELADVYYVLGRNDDALKTLEAAEREGIEPGRTMFLRGLVLVKKRKYAEAEAAFEKSKTLDPKLVNEADYQIATIYQHQGKQDEARDRFTAVAAKEPASDVGQMAKQQADALSKRTRTGERFQATVSTLLQWDSNVTLKPDNAPAAANISYESDKVAILTINAAYAASLLPEPYALKFQYALFRSVYEDLTEYNVLSHTFGIVPGYAFGDSSVLVPLSYNMTEVDGKDYLKVFTLAPLYIFTPVEGQQAQASLRYQQKDFQSPVTLPDENRDSTDVGAGLAWYWLFAQQKGFVNIKYEINREDATGRNWSYLGNRFSAGTLYSVTDALKLSLGLDAYLQTYTNTNTSFEVKQKDTTVTLTAQALYRLWRNIDAQLQYVYMKDDSNIPVYTFSKNIIGIGLYAKF